MGSTNFINNSLWKVHIKKRDNLVHTWNHEATYANERFLKFNSQKLKCLIRGESQNQSSLGVLIWDAMPMC